MTDVVERKAKETLSAALDDDGVRLALPKTSTSSSFGAMGQDSTRVTDDMSLAYSSSVQTVPMGVRSTDLSAVLQPGPGDLLAEGAEETDLVQVATQLGNLAEQVGHSVASGQTLPSPGRRSFYSTSSAASTPKAGLHSEGSLTPVQAGSPSLAKVASPATHAAPEHAPSFRSQASAPGNSPPHAGAHHLDPHKALKPDFKRSLGRPPTPVVTPSVTPTAELEGADVFTPTSAHSAGFAVNQQRMHPSGVVSRSSRKLPPPPKRPRGEKIRRAESAHSPLSLTGGPNNPSTSSVANQFPKSPKLGGSVTSKDGASPEGDRHESGIPRISSVGKVTAVQIDHTGQQKELPEGATRPVSSKKSNLGTPLQYTVNRTVTKFSKYVNDDDDGGSNEPGSILPPATPTCRCGDDVRPSGYGSHKPRTHSIQSLFKRNPVARVVQHVSARHHTPVHHAVASPPPDAPAAPPDAVADQQMWVTVTKKVTLRDPDEKLGVRWHGVCEGKILAGCVQPEGAADRAGIREGMRLVSIAGLEIHNKGDLEDAIGPDGAARQRMREGETVLLILQVPTVPGDEKSAPLQQQPHPLVPFSQRPPAGDQTGVDIGDAEDPKPPPPGARQQPDDTSSSDSSNESYDEEIIFTLLPYHPIFEAVWLPCLTASIAHTCFLQLPLIVGSVGCMWTLLIILFTALVCTLSLVSINALLNRRMTASNPDANSNYGPYHMLSRHLGTEYGGAVGLMYWLVLVLLCSLHAKGIGEAGYWYWGADALGLSKFWMTCFIAWTVQFFLVLMTARGVMYVSVTELVAVLLTLTAIVTSTVGLCEGTTSHWKTGTPTLGLFADNWLPDSDSRGDDALGVFGAFSRFFPSSLAILIVLGRATDMKEPEKDLCRGTLKAMSFCWVVFGGVTVLLGCTLVVAHDEGSSSSSNFSLFSSDASASLQVFSDTAWPSSVLFQVVFLIAVLVQCAQAIIIAPYCLSAIAMDHIVPLLDVFQDDEVEVPIKALISSAALAAVLVPLGDYLYNSITMVSLICFFFINGVAAFTCFMESSTDSSRSLSSKVALAGFIFSLYALFSMQRYIVLTSLLVALGIAKYLEIRSDFSSWGEGVKGVQLQHALEKLLCLESTREQSKNWRPQLMVLIRLDKNRAPEQPRLISVAEQLKGGKGLVIFAAVIEGDVVEKRAEVLEAKSIIREHMANFGVNAFCKVIAARSFLEGHTMMLQCLGLGALNPNTVLAAWPEDWKTRSGAALEFTRLLHIAHEVSKAVLVVRGLDSFPCAFDDDRDVVNTPTSGDHIDLWWIVHDGGIELLIAFLLRQQATWKKADLRIFTIIPAGDDTDSLAQALSKELARLRIDAILIVHPVEGEWIREFTCNQEEEAQVKHRVMEALKMTELERSHEVEAVLMSHHRSRSNWAGTPTEMGASAANPNATPGPGAPPLDIRTPVMDGRTPGSGAAHSSSFFRPSMSPSLPRTWSQGGGTNNFDGFPMVELIGGNHRMANAGSNAHIPSVTFHFECLNELIREHSCPTDLVVISLPDSTNFYTPEEFMDCMDKMLYGITRAILIRGTGEQVITGYW